MVSKDHWVEVFSVLILLEDLDNHRECIIFSVYGPNANLRRNEFWNELDDIRARWNRPWCIGVISTSLDFLKRGWGFVKSHQRCLPSQIGLIIMV